MACGCYVVGYSGGGGDEFFDPGYCTPVGSTLELIRELERTMRRPLDDLARAGAHASAVILDRYSADGLRADLSAIYAELVKT
nr:hypothetical protein GCM10025699_06790 [Microbacterium flavescens]